MAEWQQSQFDKFSLGQQHHRSRSVINARILRIQPFIYLTTCWNFRSFFVVASRTLRPGQIYKVAATVYSMKHQITVRASIQCNGVEITSDSRLVKKGITEVLLMRVRFAC